MGVVDMPGRGGVLARLDHILFVDAHAHRGLSRGMLSLSVDGHCATYTSMLTPTPELR